MIRLPQEVSQGLGERIANSLTNAPARQPLEVVGIDDDSGDAIRLRALGVCDGRQVELLRSGDPLIVRVMGSRIGISRRLADQVRVLHR